MKKISFFVALVGLLVILSTCEHKASSLIILDETHEEIASSYVSNMLKFNELLSPMRSLERTYPEFLTVEYEIEEGGDFNLLSETEKQAFFDRWLGDYEKILLDKFKENDGLVGMIKLENDVLKLTLYDAARYVTSVSENDFLKLYEKNYYYLTNSLERGTGDKQRRITRDCLVQNSFDLIKANYKQGRILVSGGPGSSSSVAGSSLGHSSMMWRDSWDEGWNDGLSPAMLTSFPKSNKEKKQHGKDRQMAFNMSH